MYWKETRWRRAQILTNGSVNRWELPECGVITGIKLDFRMVNSADIATTPNERICNNISRIIVMSDKQDILFNMSGDELRALNFYSEGHILSETATLLPGKSQLTTLFIPFGRYKCDREYLLHMDKFCQLWLEIHNNLDNKVCADGDCNVDIQIVEAVDLDRVPASYLKHWEYTRQRPVGANQDILVEVPSYNPVKMVMAHMIPDLDETNKPKNDPVTDANRLVMTLAGDQKTVWDMRPKDIMRENGIIYGRVRAEGKYYTTTAWNMDTTIAYVECFTDAPLTGFGNAYTFTNEDSTDRYTRIVEGSLDPVQAALKLHAVGVGYYHTMMLWDSLRANGNDPLGLVCGCDMYSPAVIRWMPTTADHVFATVIGAICGQGKS